MSKRNVTDQQVDTISRSSPFVQQSLDLKKQDDFVTSQGIDFIHYIAIPSPIGLKDRGDYRRNDGVDTITSNGMIYKCAGRFTATITDNSRDQKRTDLSLLDPSRSNLVLHRFYYKNALADGDRIYLSPGDRLYIADSNADVRVANYQKMDFETGRDNIPMFPICKLITIIDSQNIEYTPNLDFVVTREGNIRWLPGGKNPGIDPDTGNGRIYAIRYLYNAYWYIVDLPKEIRITNVTTNGVRSPERMAYNAVIVREYMFHNQNRSSSSNQLKPTSPARLQQGPTDSITPDRFQIQVDMSDIGDTDSGEQS